MHRLPRLDADAARLLRKVGVGRRIEFDGGALSLAYRRAGGNGLIVSGHLEQKPVQWWIDEPQWRHWIEPVLAVADASSIPEELHEALAAWTFDAIGCGLDGSAHHASMQWPAGSSLRTADVEPRLGWCLRAEQGERRVDVLVLDAPHDWLDTLADRLAPCRPVHDSEITPEVRIRAGLLAGWTSVARSAAASLRVGDALLLRRTYRVARGEFGLFVARPLARVRCGETGVFTIEEVMDELNDWLDVEPPAPALDDRAAYDPLVTIVAEVCGFDVPVSVLAALKPGDVLMGEARADEFVALKAGGRLIARATLLDIDGRLAARIEAL